jgi:hypothetical protein
MNGSGPSRQEPGYPSIQEGLARRKALWGISSANAPIMVPIREDEEYRSY